MSERASERVRAAVQASSRRATPRPPRQASPRRALRHFLWRKPPPTWRPSSPEPSAPSQRGEPGRREEMAGRRRRRPASPPPPAPVAG